MKRLGWGLIIVMLVGCTSSDLGRGPGEGIAAGDVGCTAGESRDCTCEDGSTGQQQCLAIDQVFGPCACFPVAESDASSLGDNDATGPDGTGPEEVLCATDLECDDGIPCTVDACQDDGCNNILPAGFCVIDNGCIAAGTPNPDNPCEACDPNSELYSWKAQHDQPCDDGNACTTDDVCDKDICRGDLFSCDDGLFCNGQETCDSAAGCVGGESPLIDDGVSCTLDLCDEITQSVTHTPDDTLCFPSDGCSVAACDALDGCYNVPLPTCCGNGIVEAGEECDDGNDDETDGCSQACIDTSDPPPGDPGCPPGQISILANPGFESGDLAPWTSNGTFTLIPDAFEGSWAAETNGNFHVAQSFPPVPVALLTSASFWTWHAAEDSPAMSIEWTYSDGTTGSGYAGTNELDGWVEVDVLDEMDPTKALVEIRTWGYSGGGGLPDITRYDSYQFCLGDGEICVPDCGGATCGDDGCGGSCGECEGGPEACVDGQCLCTPDCSGASCGDDGCGGSCGECDGETPLCIEGVCSELPPTLPACENGDISVLHNPGFEDGAAVPWTSNGNIALVADAFEGAWAAETNGNFHVAQSFPPVPVSLLTSASFWTWHEPGAGGIMSVSWSYSDGSTGSTFLGSGELDGWVQVHLLALMDGTKELSGITTWGYTGGGEQPDITRYDGYQFCLGDGEICVPDCGGATCGDDGCGGSCGECEGGPEACVDGQCLCTPECGAATCGDDGCGGSCGECDGETPLCIEGICSELPPTLPACESGDISVLHNPGFEDGMVEPWTSNGTITLVPDAFEGSWAAETNGNFHVSQSFPPVPVDQLTSASFWTWHEPGAGGIMSVSWSYSDGSTGSTFLGSGELDGWVQVHLLALMDGTKELTGITAWGYSGGNTDPDLARHDGFQFCVGGGQVCEPECAGATCGDDGCGGSCGTCDGGEDACIDGTCLEGPVSSDICEGLGIPVLHNPGFEDGVFAPWTSNGDVTLVEGVEGTFAAEVNGNFHIAQSFEPVPVALLSSATFWTWHAPGSGPAMSITWGYGDGTNGSVGMGGGELDGWVEVDLLPLMENTKDLVSIQTWGYTGGSADPDLTRFDAYAFCLGP